MDFHKNDNYSQMIIWISIFHTVPQDLVQIVYVQINEVNPCSPFQMHEQSNGQKDAATYPCANILWMAQGNKLRSRTDPCMPRHMECPPPRVLVLTF